MAGILDEMGVHVKYCQDWGLGQDEMVGSGRGAGHHGLHRFVLDKGVAGDLLDLHVALAPCIIGYAEIGARLKKQCGDDVSEQSLSPLDRLLCRRRLSIPGRSAGGATRPLDGEPGGAGRVEGLSALFRKAFVWKPIFGRWA